MRTCLDLAVVVLTCNSSPQEAEAEGSQVQGLSWATEQDTVSNILKVKSLKGQSVD